MKKYLLALIFLTIATGSLLAQSPGSAFNYQTLVRDVSGNIVINQSVSFQISILEDAVGGMVSYSETHSAATNQLGLVTLKIGNGTPVLGTFAGIDWPGHDHFIKVEFDILGGTSYSLMGTSQLLSVPYALHAATADKATNVDSADEIQQLSLRGDTLIISKGNFVVIPGLSFIPSCVDGILNGNETGIDCGGPACVSCATRCSDGIQSADETGVDCGGLTCVSCAVRCSDEIQNGDETGVDCGGADCVSCTARCNDGIQNGDETGTDCGGADCISCVSRCNDGIQNGDETGVDCGGTDCIPCAVRCSDGIQNVDETGVDCGGSACISCPARCNDGQLNGDETGVDCGGADCVTCTARCSDGVQNGDETAVDCGGADCISCAVRCSDGIQNVDETGVDCGGSACVTCASRCSDGIQNGDETGLDCGGISCTPCNLVCNDGLQNSDETGVDCGGTYCVSCATRCTDGIQNGDETGVDCGGTSCISCPARCSDGITNGDETYVDCGGASCSDCHTAVQQRLNSGETPISIYNSGLPLSYFYGKTYQGGLIFHLNTTTGYGLVAAPSNLVATLGGFGFGAKWGCNASFIAGADGNAIGTGAQNTLDILAHSCTQPQSAAELCNNLTLGGYSNWFLPSRDELTQMCVKLKNNGFGNFATGSYWSSTEVGYSQAHSKTFSGCNNFDHTKDGVLHVRAVHSF